MTDDSDLKDLEELWHGIGGGRDAGRDVARARRRYRRELRYLAAESLISALGVLAGTWFVLEGDLLTGLCAIAFSVLGAAIAWTTRRANMRTLTGSVSDHLEAHDRLRKVALRQYVAGLVIAVVALVFILIARRDIDFSAEPAWLLLPAALIGLGGWYVARIRALRGAGGHDGG